MKTPTCLRKLHHPAIGVRLPEIFLPGIVAALTKHRVAAGLMLSFGRETAPAAVIRAPGGKYPITQGHTGTSIRAYQTAAAAAARVAGIPLEVEADHLIIIGSPERAAARITGVHSHETLDRKKLEASLNYNERCIEEAAEVGVVGCFTTDTSDLFRLEADAWKPAAVQRAFARTFKAAERERLRRDYAGQTFSFVAADGGRVKLAFTEMEAMRLALKYQASLAVNLELFKRIQKHMRRPFSFEISMDETEGLTPLPDAFFYLREWTRRGAPVDYFAPNLGFKKRADYDGDLSALEARARKLHAVAASFDGALLSIHSGSGTSPYSGKGRGTYGALLRATGGRLKYKISGVYYELLLELLAARPKGTPERKLFEEIFANSFLRCVEEWMDRGPLATPLLEKQIEAFSGFLNRARRNFFPPRADFFRFHSYLALNLRDARQRRFLRNSLVKLYRTRPALRREVDREVQALTERLIHGLRFEKNFPA
jgi:tagaturonate epimerase